MKTKSRNLLTVILALLCAAAVALGIGFLLPKAEKINANAATNAPELVFVGDYNMNGTETNVWTSGGFTLRDVTSSTALCTGEGRFSIRIKVPAYTEYTISYKIKTQVRIKQLTGSSTICANVWVDRYEDSTYSTVVQNNIANVIFQGNSQGDFLDGGDTDGMVSNIIFVNDSAAPKTFETYYGFRFVDTQKSKATQVASQVYLDSYNVEATKLAVPATNDTLTMDYDGSAHMVNFEYAKAAGVRYDLDGKPHNYTTGYKNVEVTVEAKDGDGNIITAPTLNLDPNEGKGSISAKDAGEYTIVFNLSDTATSYGIEWVGGGNDKRTLKLIINKIDPTVNPVYGEPAEVDGNPGKWFTSNNLYNDITIETTTGDTAGTISWDADQTLTVGTKNYSWTFTPTDTRNYNTKTGTKSLTVENLEIVGIKAKFNQGTTKFFTSSKLDDLKVKLAVFRVYNDGKEGGDPIDAADYKLAVDGNGGKLVAGKNTITVTYTTKITEKPPLETLPSVTFEVEITAVELESISARFEPEGDIYVSNSLEDLLAYLTVTGKYNDKSTETLKEDDYSITSPSALSLGTVTVTVASTEDGTITDTFTVTVLPDPVTIELKLPEVDDITYSGEEFDVLDELKKLTAEQVTKYLDVTGTVSGRDVNVYTVKFKIKDEFVGSVKWEDSTPAAVKYSLSSKVATDAQLSADGRTVTLKWNIIKAKVAAVWDSENCVWVPEQCELAETTESNFLVQTYTNSSGKSFTSRSKLAGGRTYQVTAKINSQYAKNIELDDATLDLMNSGDETYTYTPEYVPGVWDKILAFLKANWLWFVIALAALIVLIIIIVVAVKCRKSKEEREEIKARKEEERRRKEEERQRREDERRMQQERLEAERELARAKQEAELEKIRAQAQAGMAGAGMASMAMAQQQPQQQQVPVQTVDNDFLKEMRQQMAELRADNKATQAQLQALQNNQHQQPAMMPMAQPMYQQYPQYQQMPMQMPMGMGGYGGGDNNALARMEAQLNAMQAEQRARYDAEQRIELAAMRAEQHVDRDSRHSVDLAAMREHFNGKVGYNNIPDYSQPNSIDALGAIVAAALKNIAGGEAAATQVPELPQKAEQEPVAKYPSDAVITTTTTVDTTKNKPIRREEDADFDVDGFYDTFE